MGRKKKDRSNDKYYIDPIEFKDEMQICINRYNEEVNRRKVTEEAEVLAIAEEHNVKLKEAKRRYLYDIKNRCLSRKALTMLLLLIDKTLDKPFYDKPEDKEDCKSYAIKDIISYWPNFDENQGFNAFAFYSSMIFTGACKGWNVLYPKKYKGTLRINNGSSNDGQGVYTI